jgi:ferredoxin
VADKNNKWEENVKGKHFVDGNCIAAKFCVASAPENFKMSDTGHAYVSKQPDGAEEEERVRQAMAGCPVNAVGDDGEDS